MGQFTGIVNKGNIGRFYTRLEESLASGWPTLLGMMFASDQKTENYKWLGMVPAMREWSGSRAMKQLRENTLSLTNKLFETSIEIDSEDIRRDKTGQTNVRIDELALRAGTLHWESLVSTLIANGAAATSGLAYDGQYFFDTDHSEGSSGTLQNDIDASDVASLNISTATAPTQAEFAVAVLDVIAYMLTYKDDQGEPINGGARQFAVYVPAVFGSQAIAAATSPTLIGASGAIADNVLSRSPFKITPIIDTRSTWTVNFAVFRTDGQTKPFILQEETGVDLSALGIGSEWEIEHKKCMFSAEASRIAGYGQWQYACRATLS